MIDKILINNKLQKFFYKTNVESFFKVFVISFLFDKINYIEKIVGTENSLKILDKNIYNLENNLRSFKKVDNYHSIYAKYDFKTKVLKYYITDEYEKLKGIVLSKEQKKIFIVKEFEIMIYKELEKIINIHSVNEKIISNGFYIEDKYGRYPEYDGDFSNIIDIFSEVEACNIININNKVKTYIDKEKDFFVYSKHISQRNSEVMNYVELWRKFLDNKLFYFAINNPKKYSEKMIEEFNLEYKYILNSKYNFLLNNKDVFSLIENYLLHIRNRINIENNIQYHKDLTTIFKLMSNKKYINKFSDYVLNESNKIDFQEL